MKRKILKSIFIAIGIVIIYGLFYRCNYHHRTAADYAKIISKLHVKFPPISETESWDNYDRGASRWDCHEYKIVFATPLSEKTIQKLERKASRSFNNWSREDCQSAIIYTCASEKEWNSDTFFWKCHICDDLEYDKDLMYIEYYIDEDEVIFNVLMYLGLLFLWMLAFVIALTLTPKKKL